jgi:hypothetical protein
MHAMGGGEVNRGRERMREDDWILDFRFGSSSHRVEIRGGEPEGSLRRNQN